MERNKAVDYDPELLVRSHIIRILERGEIRDGAERTEWIP